MIEVIADDDLRDIDRLLLEMTGVLEKAVAETAFYIEAQAKLAAPVDTGAYRASIHTLVWGKSNYERAIASATAAALKKKKQVEFVGPAEPPANRFEAVVAVGVEYGIHIEYGAFHRRGNTKQLGNRSGRIGVELESGVFASYQAGFLVMTDAAAQGRAFFRSEIKKALAILGPSRRAS